MKPIIRMWLSNKDLESVFIKKQSLFSFEKAHKLKISAVSISVKRNTIPWPVQSKYPAGIFQYCLKGLRRKNKNESLIMWFD